MRFRTLLFMSKQYSQTVRQAPGLEWAMMSRDEATSRQTMWLKASPALVFYIFGQKLLSGPCRANLVYNLSCALSPLLHSHPKLTNKLGLWLN